jgi:hypothetical protein
MICCSKCGAKAKPGCNCGVAYAPAHVFAAKAVAAHPEKSDRAIAAEIGIDHKTVAKARKTVGEKSPTRRIGADGKQYRATRRMIPAMVDAMRARAEAVARLFPPAVKTIPEAARVQLIKALRALASAPANERAAAALIVERQRARLNLDWSDLLVPSHENQSALSVAPSERALRVTAAA